MNFSIYLNDELGKKLEAIAKEEKVSRNSLIVEAIDLLIEKKQQETWSDEILAWKGCPEFELADRDDLLQPEELVL